MKFWSNPKRAGRMIARLLVNAAGTTGVYYDDGGQPTRGSAAVHDPEFTERVVAETRVLLPTVAA
jgi:hypothetical protein